MKLNISVEIDYIDEEGNIDDEVKHSIIQGVKNAISKDCMERVKNEASKSIEGAMESATKLVEQEAINTVKGWLNKKVEITDQYGDVIQEGTLNEIIKKSFDKTLNKQVDSNGNFTGRNGYGAKCSLLQWVVDERVKDVVAKSLDGYSRDIDKKVKEAINAGIKENVSNRFAEMIIETAKSNQAAKVLELES